MVKKKDESGDEIVAVSVTITRSHKEYLEKMNRGNISFVVRELIDAAMLK